MLLKKTFPHQFYLNFQNVAKVGMTHFNIPINLKAAEVIRNR